MNKTTGELRNIRADGVVGLGFEALALFTRPSIMHVPPHTSRSTFSVYINALPGEFPSSELTIGGGDSSLSRVNDQHWLYSQLVPDQTHLLMGIGPSACMH